MRIVLDTNILVRAAADEQGLAGRLLGEIISGPHILVISPYILSEIARVLSYPRLQARWQLNEKTIMEFVSRVGDVAEIVLTTTPDRVVIADPDDGSWAAPVASNYHTKAESQQASMARSRRVGIGSRVAARHLGAPPALLQIVGGLLLGGIADLNVIVHRDRTAGFRQPRGRPLMLDHVGLAFNGGHAALHAYLELLDVDLGLGELGADGRLDGCVRLFPGGPGRRLGRRRGFPLVRRDRLGLAHTRGRGDQQRRGDGWSMRHTGLQLPKVPELLRILC